MPAEGAQPTSAAGEHGPRGEPAEDGTRTLRAEASPFKPGRDILEAGAAPTPLDNQIMTVDTRATINYDWSCAAPVAEEGAPAVVPPSGKEGPVDEAACTATAVEYDPRVAPAKNGAGPLCAEAHPFKPRGAGRRVHWLVELVSDPRTIPPVLDSEKARCSAPRRRSNAGGGSTATAAPR